MSSNNPFHTITLKIAEFTLDILKKTPKITAEDAARQFSEQNGVVVKSSSTRILNKKDQVAGFLIAKDVALDMVDSGDFSKCLYLFTLGVHCGNVCGSPLPNDSPAISLETAVCDACNMRKRSNPLSARTQGSRVSENAAATRPVKKLVPVRRHPSLKYSNVPGAAGVDKSFDVFFDAVRLLDSKFAAEAAALEDDLEYTDEDVPDDTATCFNLFSTSSRGISPKTSTVLLSQEPHQRLQTLRRLKN